MFAGFIDQSYVDKIRGWIEDELGKPVLGELARIQLEQKYKTIKGDWIQADLLSYDSFTNLSLNKIKLDAGRFPENEYEVVLLTSFGESEHIGIGETIKLYTLVGNIEYKVVGYYRTIEFASYDLIQRGAFGFLTSGLNRFLGFPLNSTLRDSFVYYLGDDISLEEERRVVERVNTEVEALVEKGELPPIGFSWLQRRVSYRQSLSDALEITGQYMAISILFIFVISGAIIFVVMHRYVQEQKVIIGAMYSYGTEKREIVLTYVFRITVLYAIGGTIGYFLGLKLLDSMASQLANSWGLFDYLATITTRTLIFTYVSAYLILLLFTLLALRAIFSLTPYEAMRGKTTELKSTGILFQLSLLVPIKIIKYAIRNLLRNRTRTLLTIGSFTLALIFASSIMFTDYSTNSSIDDYFAENIQYDILVHVGFEDSLNTSRIQQLHSIPGITSIEPRFQIFGTIVGYPDKVTYLIGLRMNSSLQKIQIIEGRMIQPNSSEIVIPNYIANQYGYQIGDDIPLMVLNQLLTFKVVGIHNDGFQTVSMIVDLEYLNAHLYVPFSSRTYAQQGLDVYNFVMIRLEENTNEKEVTTTLNTEYSWIEYAISVNTIYTQQKLFIQSQMQVVYILVVLSSIIGFITVFTTQFITLLERDKEFGMLQVFGFYKRELFGETLGEILVIGLISLTLVFLVSPFVSTYIWIQQVANQILFVTFHTSTLIQLLAFLYSTITLFLSHLISFHLSTKLKPHETIRME